MKNKKHPYLFNVDVCDCELCCKKEYNPEKYTLSIEDFKKLNENRINGISGHLRVLNEEMSLKESIESCLPFLDELIITYNKSSDKSEEILKLYKQKYPNKINLYYYEPYIVSSSWISYTNKDKDMDERKDFRQTTSIHNPANYYNFGLTKIKYKYYMKIDADQIYFTDKLIKIRKILLEENEKKKQVKFFFKILSKITNFFIISNKNYFIPLFMKAYNSDFAISMGGINICWLNENENTFVPKKRKLNSCTGDHLIFKPTFKNFYYQSPKFKYEKLNIKIPKCFLGLCWLHVQYLKKNIDDEFAKNLNLIEWKDFSNKKNQFFLLEKLSPICIYQFFWFNYFFIKNWKNDKNFLEDKLISKLIDIREWTKNNKYKKY